MTRFGVCLLLIIGAAIAHPGARRTVRSAHGGLAVAAISVDCPKNGASFPPEFPAPTFEWRDQAKGAASWRIEVRFADGSKGLSAKSQGERIRVKQIDPRCVSKSNKPPELMPEQAAGHSWKPDAETWAAIQKHAVQSPATVTISGYRKSGASQRLSFGKVVIWVSANRAVNMPEFVKVAQDGLLKIDEPAADFYKAFDNASELAKRGQYEASIPEWKRAIDLNPADARGYVGMGVALAATGGSNEGIALFKKAMEVDPKSPDAYTQMGILFARQGNYEEAIPYLSKAVELNPRDALTRGNLCGALALSNGRTSEAIDNCRQAVGALPDDVQSHANLAIALSNAGKVDESIAELATASKLAPADAAIHRNLSLALAQKGRVEEAIQQLEKAMQIEPGFADGYFYLGALYSTHGRLADALAQWRHLLDLQPSHVLALNSLARALATGPDASLRNGAEAVGLAERAAHLSGGREPVLLDTLAAAYAEVGRFPDAARTERQALELAAQSQSPQTLEALKARLSLYETGQAFHER